MGQYLGNAYRLQLNTGSTETPVWENLAGEVSVTLDGSADTLEVANKDIGKHKSYKKLRLDTTLSCTVQENDTLPASTQGFPDMYTIYQENESDTLKGIREYRLNTSKVGQLVFVFTAIIDSCSIPAADQALIEYTLGFKVVSLPVATPVAGA